MTVDEERLRTEVTTKTSGRSVADTVSRLGDLVHDRGMKLFAVIDQRAEAVAVGLTLRETVLVLFGNPRAGTPAMQENPLAALDLPLRVLVWDDDGRTRISYVAPTALAARYGLSPATSHRLAALDALTDALVTEAA